MKYKILLTLILCIQLIFLCCSKKSTKDDSLPALKSGIVQVWNPDKLDLMLRGYSHTRGNQTIYRYMAKIISSSPYVLPNLIDGGIVFKGGDELSMTINCARWDKEAKARLKVDGDRHITISGYCNCRVE